jgi:hypothetical protein
LHWIPSTKKFFKAAVSLKQATLMFFLEGLEAASRAHPGLNSSISLQSLLLEFQGSSRLEFKHQSSEFAPQVPGFKPA